MLAALHLDRDEDSTHELAAAFVGALVLAEVQQDLSLIRKMLASAGS